MKIITKLLLPFLITSSAFAPALDALLTTSFSLYLFIFYRTVLDTVLLFHTKGPANQP